MGDLGAIEKDPTHQPWLPAQMALPLEALCFRFDGDMDEQGPSEVLGKGQSQVLGEHPWLSVFYISLSLSPSLALVQFGLESSRLCRAIWKVKCVQGQPSRGGHVAAKGKRPRR